MKRTAVVFLLALVAASAFALEVVRGDIRLVLHEDSSRYALYVRSQAEWLPLFFAEDPRTSALEVLEGNRVHRMGDSGNFSQTAEVTPEGARYVWTSPTLRVVQDFAFTRGITSDHFDAVEMSVSVTNEGEEPSLVGVRLLFDTYLGERNNVHFVTPGVDQITREARLEPGPVNRYVASVEEPDAAHGFQVMLDAEAISTPSSAVLANWKRLTDSTWDYEVNETRNFNRLPYSINDSALAVFYEPAQLRSGERYSISALMGDLSPSGYLSPELAAETTGENPLLERLSNVVTRINDLLRSGDLDAEEVAELEAELESISNLIRGR